MYNDSNDSNDNEYKDGKELLQLIPAPQLDIID
jgi:hypothetical protein